MSSNLHNRSRLVSSPVLRAAAPPSALRGVERDPTDGVRDCSALPAGLSHAHGARRRLDVLVAGYASLDYIWHGGEPPAPGKTTLLTGPVDPTPRFGGCGPNVAVQLASLGRRVALVTWIGDDAPGHAYLEHLRSAGVETAAVEVAPGQPSPRTLLIYDRNGAATCLYHPSGSAGQRASLTALDLVPEARLLALTVAPAPLTMDLLDRRASGQLLAWNVKADPNAYPAALRGRLVREADLICLNGDELAFVAETGGPGADAPAIERIRAAGHAIVILTAGPAGCTVAWTAGEVSVPADPVEVDDPTGVGDAFFAASVHALLDGASPIEAARRASAHAAQFLRTRSTLTRMEEDAR